MMTRLELIAQICKRLAQQSKDNEGRADEEELLHDKELSFDPYHEKLDKDDNY